MLKAPLKTKIKLLSKKLTISFSPQLVHSFFKHEMGTLIYICRQLINIFFMILIKFHVLTIVSLILFYACSAPKPENSAIIEIIDADSTISFLELQDLTNGIKVDNGNVYRWKNHWIIYSDASLVSKLSEEIEKVFPTAKLKLYNLPFYNFNREKLTGEKPAKEWEHIIMTANLVNDIILQNEYMEYHRTQFEKWPEISKGFINADFQQLLVFRNGRQLMLVISIPKGKTLEELNPKTTENNPRVDEWNKIMAKYQEGIEDAPQETTWVMFSKNR